MIRIAPSILAADFANLAAEVADVERGGADWIHVDAMDGHFVPNLTLGPIVVESLRPRTSLPLDVHLMIESPDNLIPDFCKAGADLITVHQEACIHLHRTVHLIKEHGVKAGIAINPATPVGAIMPLINDIDLILIMTINPGFGGQTLIPFTLEKIRELKRELTARSLERVHIEVDGGVNVQTAKQVIEAGADVLVAGTAVFRENNRAEAIRRLRG